MSTSAKTFTCEDLYVQRIHQGGSLNNEYQIVLSKSTDQNLDHTTTPASQVSWDSTTGYYPSAMPTSIGQRQGNLFKANKTGWYDATLSLTLVVNTGSTTFYKGVIIHNRGGSAYKQFDVIHIPNLSSTREFATGNVKVYMEADDTLEVALETQTGCNVKVDKSDDFTNPQNYQSAFMIEYLPNLL